jgi:hypothetical protein
MQSRKPAESLLQRLLQSDKIRNSYRLHLEDENDCTKISLCYLRTPTLQPEITNEPAVVLAPGNFFQNQKDFFGGN